MSAPQNIFNILRQFKEDDGSGILPEPRLLKYLSNVLGAVERLHVDFKEKHNRWHHTLDYSDKKNLAKAVSGFANSGGGVLIWGVEDKTLRPRPISDVQPFLSSLMQLAPQTTDPPVEKLDGDWIPSEIGSTNSGYAFVIVPESSLPPHRVILNQKEIKNHYYVRSGDQFLIATHTQLEDMFGRRPKPFLDLSTRLVHRGSSGQYQHIYVVLGIENRGRGVAKSPFLSIRVHEPYRVFNIGIDGTSIVIHSGVIHDVTAVRVKIDPERSVSEISDLIVGYTLAAEGIAAFGGEKRISGTQLFAALNIPV